VKIFYVKSFNRQLHYGLAPPLQRYTCPRNF